jgi:hypothetical protein
MKNYTVAFCDILGFKKFVENNSLKEVVVPWVEWIRKSLYHSIHKGRDFPKILPLISELLEQSKVGLYFFSDSIIIYTIEDDDESLEELISTIGWLLFETIPQKNTHLRCGIAYGEAYIDTKEQIFVGRPFIDAYLLEEDQKWSGGALTEEAEKRVPEGFRDGQFPGNWPLVRYKMPLQNIKYKKPSNIAINWTFGLHAHPSELIAWSQQSEEPTSLDWEKTPDLCEKFVNTKRFHDAVCSQCKR